MARFDARTGLTCGWLSAGISQAFTTQRAGAPWTTGAGICLHLLAKRTGGVGGGAKRSGNLHSDLRFIADGGVAVGMPAFIRHRFSLAGQAASEVNLQAAQAVYY